MAIERTLSIIKPDAVEKKVVGQILSRFEESGLELEMVTTAWLDEETAKVFYAEHEGKDFFDGLIEFMVSGPMVLIVLRGENAIALNRVLMGATDPSQAEAGTLRADFGEGTPNNAVHGSDSAQSAEREINFFFQLEV